MASEAEQIKRSFRNIDKNGDGTISREELAGVFLGSGSDWTKEDVDEMIAAVDKNGDGNISYEEFVNWVMQGAGSSDMKESAKSIGEVTIGEDGMLPLLIQIKSCKGLRNADWMGKSDPYCTVSISNEGTKRRTTVLGKFKEEAQLQTDVVWNTLDPVWNFEAVLENFRVSDTVIFRIFDRDAPPKSDDLLGTVTLKAEDMVDKLTTDKAVFSGKDKDHLVLDAGKGYKPKLKLAFLPGVVEVKKAKITRYDELQPSPPQYQARGRFAIIGFKVPGAKNGGTDKGKNGIRLDSIPIANGIIAAGGACELVEYVPGSHDSFASTVKKFDAVIVRINPGQLSQGTPPGTQERFDALMNELLDMGKLVWSSPKVQTQMGAKDALVKIKDMPIGLKDTFAYYSKEELCTTFKKTMAFQPRVIKQNRGSGGEGIWLCWLEGKSYCKEFGASTLDDGDKLKLMEMNDNHVEHHTVKEFLTFCVEGPEAEGAGEWKSAFPGKYFEGGREAGGQLVDQRLLPRIKEGEVRVLMVGDVCQMIIHKLPEGGLSAVGGNSKYTYFDPSTAKYASLYHSMRKSLPNLMSTLGLENEPLPILWTADFIPKDPDGGGGGNEFVVGEFNCSCVGINKFQEHCGGSMADVSDKDYTEGAKLADLIGQKAVESAAEKLKAAGARYAAEMYAGYG